MSFRMTPPRTNRDGRPHISRIYGEWYAFRGKGNAKTANLLLVPAINFCNRMNEKGVSQNGSHRV